MPISPERLAAHADQFHAVAEQQLRKHRAATTFLVFVPEAGEPTLMALPTGQLPATARAIEIARQTRARALILTGEVWTAVSTLAPGKAANLPLQDIAAPGEQSGRGEAIVTLAVPADGGPVQRRASTIMRGPFGVTLRREPTGQHPARPDGLTG